MAPDGGKRRLRIAVAMNGGVSLAVWMGGVTTELARLVRGEGTYGALTEVAGFEAHLDVITGTSAGGINGALLAAALVHGTDVGAVRDLWINTGSFQNLLRDPLTDTEPPSLLKGDEFFLPELRAAFRQLVRPHRTPSDELPIELTLTATRLHGRERQLADDFGTTVADVSHRMRFEFRRGPGREDDFGDPNIIERLALAARTTASFPGAFEPSFVPVKETVDAAHPDMHEVTFAGRRSKPTSGFAVDGGVLDNKPIELALDGIARQRHRGSFRRALLYIVPDPGETNIQKTENPAEPPDLADVVLRSLVTIPRNETVVAALKETREVNRRSEEVTNVRLALGCELNHETMEELAVRLLPVYRRVRSDRSLRYVVEQLSEGLADKSGVGFPYRGRREELHRSLSEANPPWIPPEDGVPSPDWSFQPETWSWGFRPTEEGLALAAIALRALEERGGGLTEEWGMFHAINSAKGDRHAWRSAGMRLEPDVSVPPNFAHDILEEWAAGAHPVPKLAVFPEKVRTAEKMARRQSTAWLAWATAHLLLQLAQAGRPILLPEAPVAKLLNLLAPTGTEAKDVLRNLLLFHVVMASLGRDTRAPSDVVEVMQVSGATKNPFSGHTAAVRSKLAGMKLGHFGAFYKRAWRANDWMHGRLDGAIRLTQLLLNPADLRERYGGGAEAVAAIEPICMGSDGSGSLSDQERQEIQDELAFLDGGPTPSDIPRTVGAVARRLQSEILVEELPTVARAVIDDRAGGRRMGSASETFLSYFESVVDRPDGSGDLDPKDAVDLLSKCEIGEEAFADDVGSDRLAEVVAKSLAVSTAALQSKASGLRGLRFVLRFLRAPVVILYLLVRNAAAENRVGPALNAAAMTFGITIVAFSLFVADVGPLEPIGWALLAAALLTLLVRTRWPLVVLGLLILAAVAGAAAYIGSEDLSFATVRPFLLAGVFLLLMSFLRWPPVKPGRLRFRPWRRIRLWWGSRRRLDPELSAEVNEVADTYLARKMAEMEPEQYRKLAKKVTRRLSKLN